MFLENKMAATARFLEPCTWRRHSRWTAERVRSILW